jgi:hypothetical protein
MFVVSTLLHTHAPGQITHHHVGRTMDQPLTLHAPTLTTAAGLVMPADQQHRFVVTHERPLKIRRGEQ